jgi:hypothetical protein
VNTRTKIVSAERVRELAQGKRVRWVRGRFDPLLAEHARRLAALAGLEHLLVVVILDSRHGLLPREARAELVAALAVVDYVTLDPAEGEDLNDEARF